jgi:Na+/proline symporter
MLLPFLTFGAGIKSNYLYNLVPSVVQADGSIIRTGKPEIPVIIAFIFASLSVSISYVLLLQPVRGSIMSLIYGNNQPTGKKEKTIRMILVVGLMAASYGLAVLLGDAIDLPINIAGLLGGNTMCFVVPFILYFRKYGFDRKNRFSMLVAATLIFCILLYPICLTGIIYSAVQKS